MRQPIGTSPFRLKWGERIGKSSYSMIPNYLIWINESADESQKLNTAELCVLLNIISTWWSESKVPSVSKSIIARRTMLSERQVQRIITSLETKKYIKRTYVGPKSGGANGFDLSGTIIHIESAIRKRLDAIDEKRRNAGEPPLYLAAVYRDDRVNDVDSDTPF